MSSTPGPVRPASLPRRAGRQLRRASGTDRDPLVRPLDRSRSRAWCAALLGLLLGLTAAVGGALLGYQTVGRDADADLARLRQVDAVVTGTGRHGAAVGSRAAGGYQGRVAAEATWTGPDGRPRTGTVEVHRTAVVGATVTIWVDEAGLVTDAPTTRAGVAVEAACAGLAGFTAVGAAVVGALALRLRALDRRAERAWQRSWTRLEPLWSGRTSRSPGGAQED
ncbi:Rv1733c family protein [Kitasatospora sp. NPDC003701]